MTQAFVGFVVHWLVLRRVLFYQVYASGMVCGIVSGMCKILCYTTYPTSVPYHLIPYALVMVVVVLPVHEL